MKFVALVLAAAHLVLVSAVPDPHWLRRAQSVRELEKALEQDAKSQWRWQSKAERIAEAESVKAEEAQDEEADLLYFGPGRIMYIYGKAPDSGSFDINLIPEYNGAYSTAIISLRLTVDVDNYHVTCNSFSHNQWLYEQNIRYSGIQPRRFFSIVIVVQTYSYEININGYHFATYSHHVPYTRNMVIDIDEDIQLDPVEYY